MYNSVTLRTFRVLCSCHRCLVPELHQPKWKLCTPTLCLGNTDVLFSVTVICLWTYGPYAAIWTFHVNRIKIMAFFVWSLSLKHNLFKVHP